MDNWDVDWWQYVNDSESLRFQAREPYTPHPYQKDAVEQVLAGFEEHDRGQLILPCGTGKTTVTLWIAEQQVGVGGRVLYLVPSIALMAQTMREWIEQKSLPLRYMGICSDTRDGYVDDECLEDVSRYRRVDDNANWFLKQFCQQYHAFQIAKGIIWQYIYGLLRAPDYREKYSADLIRGLPRVPFAPDFGAF